MSIVEFSGGPVTHRYFMNKSKSWLASEIIDLATRLGKHNSRRELTPDYDRWALLAKSKHELASETLRLTREFVAARDAAHV